MLKMIDYKKNNKIGLRNFSANCDFHDVVKLLLVRMLRRKHSNSNKIPIYTEYSPRNKNKEYPDIWMELKDGIVVYEIQDKITTDWKEKIIKKYEKFDLIIVPLSNLSHNLDKLKVQLKDYIV